MKMKVAFVAGTAMSVAASAQMINDGMGAAGPILHTAEGDAGQGGTVRAPLVEALPYDGVATYGSAAQDFESAFDIYDIFLIEDMVLANDANLTEFRSDGFDNLSGFAATDFFCNVWDAGTGGVPGQTSYNGSGIVASSVRGAGFFDGAGGVTTMGGACVAAGSYYLVWQIRLDFTVGGQVFFYQQLGAHTVGGGAPDNAWQWNPGNAFGFGTHQMLTCGNCTGADPIGANFQMCGDPGDCGVGGCPDPNGCGDWDGDGDSDSDDFFEFLDSFVAGDPCADFDGDGDRDSDDFFEYLDRFVQPC